MENEVVTAVEEDGIAPTMESVIGGGHNGEGRAQCEWGEVVTLLV
jgi:hypothetical protein